MFIIYIFYTDTYVVGCERVDELRYSIIEIVCCYLLLVTSKQQYCVLCLVFFLHIYICAWKWEGQWIKTLHYWNGVLLYVPTSSIVCCFIIKHCTGNHESTYAHWSYQWCGYNMIYAANIGICVCIYIYLSIRLNMR